MTKKHTIYWSIVGLCTIAFALLTWQVLQGHTNAIDKEILVALESIRTPGLNTLMETLTYFGSWEAIVIICLLYIAYDRGDFTGSAIVIVTAITTTLFRTAVKALMARPRPFVLWDNFHSVIKETGYSYPSGHSIASMSIYLVILLLLLKKMDKGNKRTALVVGFGFFAVFVGLTRLYLGVHYPSDVLAGWLSGIAWALTVFALVEIIRDKIESANRKA